MFHLPFFVALFCLVSISCAAEECGGSFGHDALQFIRRKKDAVLALPLELRDAAETDRVAVIVEPRPHPCIRFVVHSVMHYLGPEWALQIFHGPDNLEYIRTELAANTTEAMLARIRFSSFKNVVDDLDRTHKAVWPHWLSGKYKEWRQAMDEQNEKNMWNLDRNVYSQGMLSATFWDEVVAENVLIFQTDSWLCRSGVDSIMHFDYVGALWRMCTYGEDHIFSGHCDGGNGGLSLRKKSLMQKWTAGKQRSTIMEDYQVALWLRQDARTVTVPSVAEKQAIFVEEVSPAGEGVVPLGIHKVWAYQSGPAVAQLLSQCMADLPSAPEQHQEL